MSELGGGFNQGVGLRYENDWRRLKKSFLWPLLKMRNRVLVDGFIERRVGQMICRNLLPSTVFLDIGCGAMELSRFIPKGQFYNGIDIELSEFHLRRVLKKRTAMNIAIASAKDIPLEDSTVSLIASAETFEHIPRFENVIKEMHRIARPTAKLVCSIPNNFCEKYAVKGPHRGHVNNWTYQEFVELMASGGFELAEGSMCGRWIRLSPALVKTSYQLPLTSANEMKNTNFFFEFNVLK